MRETWKLKIGSVYFSLLFLTEVKQLPCLFHKILCLTFTFLFKNSKAGKYSVNLKVMF